MLLYLKPQPKSIINSVTDKQRTRKQLIIFFWFQFCHLDRYIVCNIQPAGLCCLKGVDKSSA